MCSESFRYFNSLAKKILSFHVHDRILCHFFKPCKRSRFLFISSTHNPATMSHFNSRIYSSV